VTEGEKQNKGGKAGGNKTKGRNGDREKLLAGQMLCG
jgi:hypothetical protein